MNAVRKHLSAEIFFHRISGEKNFSAQPADFGEKIIQRYQ